MQPPGSTPVMIRITTVPERANSDKNDGFLNNNNRNDDNDESSSMYIKQDLNCQTVFFKVTQDKQ